MARIDEVRERYESITEQLYKNKETFAEYLKFAGKFYKMPTAQTMTMFATNPKATMVADYDTWKKFGHYVKRGANSIAVLCGNGLKHYFDISQTNGERVGHIENYLRKVGIEMGLDNNVTYNINGTQVNIPKTYSRAKSSVLIVTSRFIVAAESAEKADIYTFHCIANDRIYEKRYIQNY